MIELKKAMKEGNKSEYVNKEAPIARHSIPLANFPLTTTPLSFSVAILVNLK